MVDEGQIQEEEEFIVTVWPIEQERKLQLTLRSISTLSTDPISKQQGFWKSLTSAFRTL